MAGKDEDGPRGLMLPAELRAALKRAEGKPASCALGVTKDRQAVILLDRLLRPRKLLANMKAQAKAGGLDLDLASLRFGRVSVDGKEVAITVNKAVAPAVGQRLKPVMRAAGHPNFTINADPSIEDEPDDADLDGAGRGHAPAAAASGAAPAPTAAAPRNLAAPPGAATGASTLPGPTAPGPSGGPPAAPGRALRAGMPDAALRARLTPLVRRVSEAVKAGQPGSERLLAAAEAAHGALRSGDLAAAGRGADDLERLLGGPAAPTPASAAVPGTPASGGAGQAALSGADALKGELAGLVGRVRPTKVADPSRAGPLLKLAKDATARFHAGDLAGTKAGIEALRTALDAPGAATPAAGSAGGAAAGAGAAAAGTVPGGPPSGALSRVPAEGAVAGDAAAVLAGMERRRADPRHAAGEFQVADSGPGGASAPDPDPTPGFAAPDPAPLARMLSDAAKAAPLAAAPEVAAAGAQGGSAAVLPLAVGGYMLHLIAGQRDRVFNGPDERFGLGQPHLGGPGDPLTQPSVAFPPPTPGMAGGYQGTASPGDGDGQARPGTPNQPSEDQPPHPGTSDPPAEVPAPPAPGAPPLPSPPLAVPDSGFEYDPNDPEEVELVAKMQGRSGMETQNAINGLRARRRGTVNTGAGTPPSGGGPVVPGQPPTAQPPTRPGAAQPTPRDGVIGGKPVGEPEPADPRSHQDMQDGLRLQAASEDAMAAAGYRVERGPVVRLDERLTKEEAAALGPKGPDPLGRVGPGKNPDARMGGNLADMVAPKTPKLEGVRDALSDKIKDRQAYRLVLNLGRTSATREQVEALLRRKPIEGLQELFIIEKNGAIFRTFPDPEQITPAPQAR